MVEEVTFQKNTIEKSTTPYKYFHWDVKNVTSLHSFGWTASAFALEMYVSNLIRARPFPKERESLRLTATHTDFI